MDMTAITPTQNVSVTINGSVLYQTISSSTVLMFDMDGTLIDTNYANFLSYNKAIKTVKKSGADLVYNPKLIYNRSILKNSILNLSEAEYERVIQEKEHCYMEFLPETKLNKIVADVLFKYSKTNKTVLVTNCREKRAKLTLNYHGLTCIFSNIFFRVETDNKNRINKYQNSISRLNIHPNSVIAFENEKPEIDNALFAGISNNNILKI